MGIGIGVIVLLLMAIVVADQLRINRKVPFWQHLKKSFTCLFLKIPLFKNLYDRQITKIKNTIKNSQLRENYQPMLKLPDHPIDCYARLKYSEDQQNHSVGGTISGARYTDDRADQLKNFAAPYFTHDCDPKKKQALYQMEAQIVSSVINMLEFNGACGFVTSGGTQSIVQALLCARNSRSLIRRPNVVFCKTAHIALNKAAFYFGVQQRSVGYDSNYRMNLQEMKAAIDDNTIMVYVSYPNYPYGACDPLYQVAEICRDKKIPVHVDLCLGGYLVKFIQREDGKSYLPFIPDSVHSISIDPHKFGLSGKGVSVLLLKDKNYGKFCVFSGQDGEDYEDPTFIGTKLGYAIATAFKANQLNRAENYKKNAEFIHQTIRFLKKEVENLGLEVMGNDEVCVIAFKGKNVVQDSAIKKYLKEKHWHVSFLVNPICLHVTATVPFCRKAKEFLADIKQGLACIIAQPEKYGKVDDMAQLYGAAQSVPKDKQEQLLYTVIQSIYE